MSVHLPVKMKDFFLFYFHDCVVLSIYYGQVVCSVCMISSNKNKYGVVSLHFVPITPKATKMCFLAIVKENIKTTFNCKLGLNKYCRRKLYGRSETTAEMLIFCSRLSKCCCVLLLSVINASIADFLLKGTKLKVVLAFLLRTLKRSVSKRVNFLYNALQILEVRLVIQVSLPFSQFFLLPMLPSEVFVVVRLLCSLDFLR